MPGGITGQSLRNTRFSLDGNEDFLGKTSSETIFLPFYMIYFRTGTATLSTYHEEPFQINSWQLNLDSKGLHSTSKMKKRTLWLKSEELIGAVRKREKMKEEKDSRKKVLPDLLKIGCRIAVQKIEEVSKHKGRTTHPAYYERK